MAVTIRASFRPGVDPEAVSLATTAGALAVCLVLAAPFLGGLAWHGVWPFLVAGLVAPGLSQVLFVRAIEAVGASRTAILVGVSPLLSALFAIDHGRVTEVAPLYATESLWAVVWSTLLLKRAEGVGPRLVLAAVLMVAGGVLIGVSR